MDDVRDAIFDPSLAESPEDAEQRNLERNALEQAYISCFASDSGRKVLADLYNRTNQVSLVPGSPDMTGFNEGRRSIVLSIMKRIGCGVAGNNFLEGFHG